MILTTAAGDAPMLAAVHAQSFIRPWTSAQLAETTAMAGVFTLVAREFGDTGAILGFVMWRVVLDEAEILTLAVAISARRAGIGTAMIAAMVSAAQHAGAVVLWLEVAEDNAAALALYAAAGFVSAGRRSGYYPRDGHAVDALVLRRSLTAATI